MEKSLRSPEHETLRYVLKKARMAAGLTQQQLAMRLGKPQSFVAKYEVGERRLDVVELITLAPALETTGAKLVAELEAEVKRQATPIIR